MEASNETLMRLLNPTKQSDRDSSEATCMGTFKWYSVRYFLDCVAIFIHIGFLAGYMAEWSGRGCASGGMTTRISLLVAMEVFVIIAHTVYTLAYEYKSKDRWTRTVIAPLSTLAKAFVRGIGATEGTSKSDTKGNSEWNFAGQPNYLKWVEYAVSATLGSISLLYADEIENPVSRNVVVPLVVLSLAEQTVGYDIDKLFYRSTTKEGRDVNAFKSKTFGKLPISILIQFLVTWAGQGTEFGVVADVGFNNNLGIAYGFYVAGWALFGGWATYLLYRVASSGEKGPDRDLIVISEAVYSGLSTFAKVTVFAFSMEEILASDACAVKGGAIQGFAPLAATSFSLPPIV